MMTETHQGSSVAQAKEMLEAGGYVVLRAASYRAAQTRLRVAEALRDAAIEDRESRRVWMEREVFPWERHLVNRLTFLADLVHDLGATREQMRGSDCNCGMSSCFDNGEQDS